MKTKAISSIFLLFTITLGMISMSPASFADHSEITITPVSGSGVSGCEFTEEKCYTPSTATVDVGGVVIFSNTDSVSHTFSSGVPSDDIIGNEFNTGMLSSGDSAEWIPETVGEIPYFCIIHPWTQGMIIVQESEETSDGQTSDGQTSDGQTSDGQTSDGQTSDGQTSDGQTSDGQTSDGQTSDGQTSDEQTSDGQTSDGQTSDGQTSDEQTSDGQTSDGQTSDGQTSDGQTSDGQTSDGQTSDGQTSDGQTSDGQTSDGQTSDGQTSDGQTSDGQTSGEETSGGETSGGETSGGETSGGETSGGETSGGETSGGETSGGETSGGETSGGETSGGETSGGETSGGETSGGETSDGETSGGETSGGETSGGETSGGETSGGEEGGGCLIATAAYGSEMAPQVQLLREIRDNQLMNTESGSAFMSGFNELYYSFSPYIADMERENPMFKEAVKLGLTPMLSSLAIMENADSESEVLGLGLSVIALNLGMYIGLPAFGLIGIRKILS